MNPPGEDDWVDAALTGGALVQDADLEAMDLGAGFDDLLAQVLESEATPGTKAGRGRRRRRLTPMAASLTLAAAVLGTAGIAAAVGSGALTGLFPPPHASENGQTEYVNMAAPDFPVVARQFAQQLEADGLRFAPGFSATKNIDRSIDETYAQAKKLGSLITGEQGVKGRFAYLAQCSWQESWLQATSAHNRAGQNAAVRGMEALTTVTVSSPGAHGTVTEHVLSGINETRTHLQSIRQMQHGEVAPIQQTTTINCPTLLK